MGIRTFDSDRITDIVFKNISGDCEIIVVDNEFSPIKVESNRDFDKKYTIRSSGSKLYIELKLFSNSFIPNFLVSDNDHLTVHIPQKKSINIDVLHSDIDIYSEQKNTNQLKEIKISQKSGDVSLRNITAQRLYLSALSGDVELENFICKNLEVSNLAGDCDMERIGFQKGIIKAQAGDINIEDILYQFEELTTTASAGDISIEIPFQRINYKAKVLAGDLQMEKIVFDENGPKLNLSNLAGDIDLIYRENRKTNGVIKAHPVFSDSGDDHNLGDEEKNRILKLLLEKKIAEKEAKELLVSLEYPNSDIDLFFEEYLIIKMNDDKKQEKDNSGISETSSAEDETFSGDNYTDDGKEFEIGENFGVAGNEDTADSDGEKENQNHFNSNGIS